MFHIKNIRHTKYFACLIFVGKLKVVDENFLTTKIFRSKGYMVLSSLPRNEKKTTFIYWLERPF